MVHLGIDVLGDPHSSGVNVTMSLLQCQGLLFAILPLFWWHGPPRFLCDLDPLSTSARGVQHELTGLSFFYFSFFFQSQSFFSSFFLWAGVELTGLFVNAFLPQTFWSLF